MLKAVALNVTDEYLKDMRRKITDRDVESYLCYDMDKERFETVENPEYIELEGSLDRYCIQYKGSRILDGYGVVIDESDKKYKIIKLDACITIETRQKNVIKNAVSNNRLFLSNMALSGGELAYYSEGVNDRSKKPWFDRVPVLVTRRSDIEGLSFGALQLLEFKSRNILVGGNFNNVGRNDDRLIFYGYNTYPGNIKTYTARNSSKPLDNRYRIVCNTDVGSSTYIVARKKLCDMVYDYAERMEIKEIISLEAQFPGTFGDTAVIQDGIITVTHAFGSDRYVTGEVHRYRDKAIDAVNAKSRMLYGKDMYSLSAWKIIDGIYDTGRIDSVVIPKGYTVSVEALGNESGRINKIVFEEDTHVEKAAYTTGLSYVGELEIYSSDIETILGAVAINCYRIETVKVKKGLRGDAALELNRYSCEYGKIIEMER